MALLRRLLLSAEGERAIILMSPGCHNAHALPLPLSVPLPSSLFIDLTQNNKLSTEHNNNKSNSSAVNISEYSINVLSVAKYLTCCILAEVTPLIRKVHNMYRVYSMY